MFVPDISPVRSKLYGPVIAILGKVVQAKLSKRNPSVVPCHGKFWIYLYGHIKTDNCLSILAAIVEVIALIDPIDSIPALT